MAKDAVKTKEKKKRKQWHITYLNTSRNIINQNIGGVAGQAAIVAEMRVEPEIRGPVQVEPSPSNLVAGRVGECQAVVVELHISTLHHHDKPVVDAGDRGYVVGRLGHLLAETGEVARFIGGGGGGDVRDMRG